MHNSKILTCLERVMVSTGIPVRNYGDVCLMKNQITTALTSKSHQKSNFGGEVVLLIRTS